MVADLNSGSESNQIVFEAYIGIREQLRKKETVRMYGEGIGLTGDAEEAFLESTRERQIKHLMDEEEEQMLFARMNGDTGKEKDHREIFEMLADLYALFRARRRIPFGGKNEIQAALKDAEKLVRLRIDKAAKKRD